MTKLFLVLGSWEAVWAIILMIRKPASDVTYHFIEAVILLLIGGALWAFRGLS